MRLFGFIKYTYMHIINYFHNLVKSVHFALLYCYASSYITFDYIVMHSVRIISNAITLFCSPLILCHCCYHAMSSHQHIIVVVLIVVIA